MNKYETAIAYASALGTEHGESAATWVEIGDTETAAALRAGIIDCDPEILDQLPYADLSGEWADTLTGQQLVMDAMAEADYDDEDGDSSVFADIFNGVCDAYEVAFGAALTLAVETRCTCYLS